MQELNAIQNASTISCDYRKTLALLRALKAGTVTLDNVIVTGDDWTVVEVPAEPAEETVEPRGVVADTIEPPEEVE